MTDPCNPVVVLGLGNPLLGDDGLGLQLLESVERSCNRSDVDFIDGGTQGLALLPYLSKRRCVMVLDAIKLGAPPGTVYVLRNDEVFQIPARHAASAHEGNGLEVLNMARLLGELANEDWPEIAIVGVEPAQVKTGVGLTPEITASLRCAARKATDLLEEMLALCV